MILSSTSRDFLDIDCVAATEIFEILKLADVLKKERHRYKPLVGKTLALIFEKPSTRTRVSFEVGMRQLGGEVTTLTGQETQLGQGETIIDTGRVLSRYVDIIMIRTKAPQVLHELAEGATVPVINGLTNYSHPCQIMADIYTAHKRLGTLAGKKIAWLGDGNNNVLTSWMHAASVFEFTIQVICPPEFGPTKDILDKSARAGAHIGVSCDIKTVQGADIIITDCWTSMHDQNPAERALKMRPYQVNEGVMKNAAPSAIFMHCLPAHRGDEVTNEVLDGPQSVVFDEAENRLHVQKAILCWCLGIDPRS